MKLMESISEWAVTPNMPIGRALILISGTHVDHVTFAALDESRHTMRQAAFSGTVKVWGNHAYVDIPAPADACSPLKEPIPREYWKHNLIHWMALEPGAMGTLSRDIQHSGGPLPLKREGNAPITPHQSDKQDHYYDLYVSRGQILCVFLHQIVRGYWRRLNQLLKSDPVARQRRKRARDEQKAQDKEKDRFPAY